MNRLLPGILLLATMAAKCWCPESQGPAGADSVMVVGGDTVVVIGGDSVMVTGGDSVFVTGGEPVVADGGNAGTSPCRISVRRAENARPAVGDVGHVVICLPARRLHPRGQ